MYRYESFNMGNNITSAMYFKYRIAVNTAHHRNTVYLNYIIVNVLQKVITNDDKNNSKEAEKILKYKDLTIEIQSMWNVKTKVIPVIIGATGTISKSFRKYVSNIPGKHEVKELQKTAILGTAHILRKVLM